MELKAKIEWPEGFSAQIAKEVVEELKNGDPNTVSFKMNRSRILRGSEICAILSELKPGIDCAELKRNLHSYNGILRLELIGKKKKDIVTTAGELYDYISDISLA